LPSLDVGHHETDDDWQKGNPYNADGKRLGKRKGKEG
jgi:hypothetical protein